MSRDTKTHGELAVSAARALLACYRRDARILRLSLVPLKREEVW